MINKNDILLILYSMLSIFLNAPLMKDTIGSVVSMTIATFISLALFTFAIINNIPDIQLIHLGVFLLLMQLALIIIWTDAIDGLLKK